MTKQEPKSSAADTEAPAARRGPLRARPHRGVGRSALGIAAARAMERERPPAERVVDDPFARHFVGEFPYRLFKFIYKLGVTERMGPNVLAWLVARERYVDETLLCYLEQGMEQLVILGAGYDARAYRFARRLKGVRIFEVDLPAMQASKRDKVEQFLDEVEIDLTWVPTDLATDSLDDVLAGHGYNPAARTFFIWQGVVPYLTADAVESTLQFVRTRSAPGSAIVFDYIEKERLESAAAEVRSTNWIGRRRGETLQFGIDPAAATGWLEGMGFVNLSQVTSEQLRDAILAGARAGRQVPPGYGILTAEAPPP